MTLMHTIVYRSRYQTAPGSVLNDCKAKRLSRMNDSFNEVSYEKQVFPVEGARQPSQNFLCHSERSEESHKFQYLHI